MSNAGTPINIWCIVRENRSVFKITIGEANDLIDLRKVIKEEKPIYFANVDPDELILWRVNVASSILRNKDTPIEIYLNDKLEEPTNTVGDTFNNVGGKYPIKKRRIEQGWKSYTASDGHSVELPSQIIDMLESNKSVPDLRINFKTAFRNLHVGQSITLPHLGQEPKHFAEGYQGRTLLVTGQMIDIWDKISADSDHSIKRVLSGPMGVGKSYISYFLASKAYAEEWPVLYIADASDLNVESSETAGEVICEYFLALNKDILTAAELKKIVRFASDRNPQQVMVTVAEGILGLIKSTDRKALLIVDEHGILFEKDPVPLRIHLLSPLMNLNFWGEHYKFARVIFTGTAHARYEREYMKNGQYEFWVIYVGPLQSNVFDILLQLHPVLRIQGIKEEAKKVTNYVPRELIYLVEYIKKLNITITNVNWFQQVLKDFEIERVDKILTIAQKYYNDLPKTEKTRYYDALTSMFLPSKPVVQFEWKFLDLGLVYRFKEGITHYLPLCPSAQKALLKMYMSFDLPENIKNRLRIGSLTGEQFEETLFNRLVCKCNTTIQLKTTDLDNNNRNVITLQFNDYDLIKNSQLSLGPGNDKVLGRGFDRYPLFDYMLGPIFIQVSVSDFVTHNSKPSTNIRKAFETMSAQAGISQTQINGRNQIEMYLDEMYGPGHSAIIDPQNRFVVTRNGTRVSGFRIVYIRGSPGIPNHSRKVREFLDVAHVIFEEITEQLFRNIV
ncbi:4180_t:CDS:2 [Ambispora gerdemannii]|uniref:4180_t:CDS:1 n=1 Tax=Ambispora gerdemannii TaxID=144530 RepID=A0A9N9D3Y9_9GLOM|nr:4180_t:CDS:2 [Ambispora gerdemannii]